jgi:transcriptional regulator with XRE-family HTH domain
VTGFQGARDALGLRLRELRRDAHLTGRALAASAGWHPSKVSKIEGGRQTPSEADIQAWAQACGKPGQAGELIASLRSLDDQYVEFRRMFRGGQRAKQEDLASVEADSRVLRNFEPVLVPGLLQTPDCARYRLAERLEEIGAPDDVDTAVAARMARQQVLYRAGREFWFVVTEAVLRYRLCPPEVMAGQLDRLVALSTLGTVRFGVIPFGILLPVAPIHGFHLYDDRVAYIEHYTSELKITQPAEIASYAAVFGQLAQAAWYGAGARAVITAAMEDLAAPSADGASGRV